MSVVAAILGENPETLQVTRSSGRTITAGISVPGAASAVEVVACVQPLGAKEAQLLPEGMRKRYPLNVIATSALYTEGDQGGAPADRFVRGGQTFEVISVEDWSTHGGYWRAVAVRVN